MRESGISTMGVGHAAIVYQNNIQPPGDGVVQQPVNQPVYNQPVNYQQPLINGSEPQDHTQLVHHQGAYLGGCDHGGYLSDVELITDIKKNFMDSLSLYKFGSWLSVRPSRFVRHVLSKFVRHIARPNKVKTSPNLQHMYSLVSQAV